MKELIIELSRNCNLACIMCGFGGNPTRQEWFMERSLLGRILDELGVGLEVIRLNGRGESTIHPEFTKLVELVCYRYPKVSLHLFTNLSFDRPDIIELFHYHNFQLFISIDSADGALLAEIRRGCIPTLIKENLKALSLMVHRPFIVSTLQESNLFQIRELAEFAVENRCHLIFNTVRYDEGATALGAMIRDARTRLVDEFCAATKILNENNLQCHCPDQMHGITLGKTFQGRTTGGGALCPSLTGELFIAYSGKVQPCNMFHPYVLGDITAQSFEDIRSSARWHWFEENHFDSNYCRNCAYLKAEV